MEELTRRAALGAVAVGAVALATTGNTEAVNPGEPLVAGIPKSFGRLVGFSTEGGIATCLFEAEDGTIRMVDLYFRGLKRAFLVEQYGRS